MEKKPRSKFGREIEDGLGRSSLIGPLGLTPTPNGSLTRGYVTRHDLAGSASLQLVFWG